MVHFWRTSNRIIVLYDARDGRIRAVAQNWYLEYATVHRVEVTCHFKLVRARVSAVSFHNFPRFRQFVNQFVRGLIGLQVMNDGRMRVLHLSDRYRAEKRNLSIIFKKNSKIL